MTLHGKPVWVVLWGDGYGHQRIEAVYQNEDAAKAHQSKRPSSFIEDYEAEIWPTFCDVCGEDAWSHAYRGHEKEGQCAFKDIPPPREKP